mmetsp:Transcript_28918/g.52341  ORF Transcript_28918/g.52341 Transcript_28918/m.52341 type:complete len:290 (+) Transcript_28918:906-1775(+)
MPLETAALELHPPRRRKRNEAGRTRKTALPVAKGRSALVAPTRRTRLLRTVPPRLPPKTRNKRTEKRRKRRRSGGTRLMSQTRSPWSPSPNSPTPRFSSRPRGGQTRTTPSPPQASPGKELHRTRPLLRGTTTTEGFWRCTSWRASCLRTLCRGARWGCRKRRPWTGTCGGTSSATPKSRKHGSSRGTAKAPSQPRRRRRRRCLVRTAAQPTRTGPRSCSGRPLACCSPSSEFGWGREVKAAAAEAVAKKKEEAVAVEGGVAGEEHEEGAGSVSSSSRAVEEVVEVVES